MTHTWFRLYSEFSHDPKVQMMSEAMQRRYIMIMCLRCSNDLVTLHETEIAFHLRVTDADLAETKQLFISKGFIDDKWNLMNWDKRQFKSDSSAERVARHRASKKTACNTDVTLQKRGGNALDTDTDTETERSKDVPPPASIPPASPPEDPVDPEKSTPRGTRLPAEWVLPKKWGEWALAEFPAWNAERVRKTADRFKDHWLANANRREGKKSDWEATWRNWCRSDAERDAGQRGARLSPHQILAPGTGAYGKTTPMTAEEEAELERQNALDPIF